MISKEDIDQVKQSAALCMLRLYRAAPDLLPNGDWQNRVVHLLNDSHLGVVTAASSLIHALAEGNPEAYSSAVGFAINRIRDELCVLSCVKLISMKLNFYENILMLLTIFNKQSGN